MRIQNLTAFLMKKLFRFGGAEGFRVYTATPMRGAPRMGVDILQ